MTDKEEYTFITTHIKTSTVTHVLVLSYEGKQRKEHLRKIISNREDVQSENKKTLLCVTARVVLDLLLCLGD